ncbi:Beta-1,3-glucosyltransferase [Synechocystis sp. PCC 6714]|nr:Beta-1,3-glucosyltransferase [Synechocystis sp. PCC 6714]
MSVYNDAQRVQASVASILGQTFTDFEFIVINDGSTDGTGEILDLLAAQDGRLQVIHQENTGLTKALIRGCATAKGEFIARQDADDYSLPDRLGQQLALINSNSRLGFVSCTTQYIGPQGEPLSIIKRSETPEHATQELLHHRQGPPAHGSVLFRSSVYDAVSGYRPEFYFAQDSDLWLRMAQKVQFASVPAVLYVHRREMGSTSGLNRVIQARFGELGQLCKTARLQGKSEVPYLEEAQHLRTQILTRRGQKETPDRRALARAAYFLGSQLLTNGDRRAIGYLWQTVSLCPTHWRSWCRLAQSLVQFPFAKVHSLTY